MKEIGAQNDKEGTFEGLDFPLRAAVFPNFPPDGLLFRVFYLNLRPNYK